MSKIKKLLQAITLGLAFSSPAHSQEQQIPPTLKEYNSQQAPQTSLRPQARLDIVKNNTFDEFLQYLAWIDKTGKISNPLNKEQLYSIREIFSRISNTAESDLSQKEKDFRMYYNRHKYELEKPLILITIQRILNAESPETNIRGSLETLIGRAPNYYDVVRNNSQIISAVFYPNEKDPQLNQFIRENINNPNEISMSKISNIHESYYKFLVGLLLVENNFGNTTTSSANAQGKFQIKPDTQQFVIDSIPNLSTKVKEDPDSLGFLHLFQVAKLFGIDITKKPTREEIVLLSYLYFQGPESYSNLYDLNDKTLNKIRDYCYNILLMIENDLITVSQDIRKANNT